MAGNASLWADGLLENDPEFASSGLSVLPAGYRYLYGEFNNQGDIAYLWTSSESGAYAWKRNLYHDHTEVLRSLELKYYGGSVRCVKD